MKKKLMRGIAAFLAAVMMLPTTALAETTTQEGGGDGNTPIPTQETQEPVPVTEITLEADKTSIYDSGEKNEAVITLKADGDVDESKITWICHDDTVILVKNGKTCTVRGNKAGTAEITAIYGTGISAQAIKIDIIKRAIKAFDVEVTTKNLEYYTGESFDRDGIKVKIQYNDSEDWITTTNYEVTPSKFEEAGTNVKVTISCPNTEFKEEILVDVLQKEVDTVDSVEIITPSSGEVQKNHIINEIKLFVTWKSGKSDVITATKNNLNGVTIGGNYTLGNKITEAISITATYGGKASDPIIITVKETNVTVTAAVTKQPTKVKYTAGEKFIPAGMEITFTYSDGTTPYVKTYGSTATSSTTLSEGTTQITLTNVTDDKGNKVNVVVTGITVTKSYTASEIDNDTDEYKLYDKEDIELKVGDILNDDVMWDDIFKKVSVKINGSWEDLDDNDDLDSYPGVKLMLKVYGKSSNSTTIAKNDVESDGTVRLQLYIVNGTTSITDINKTIRVYVPVTEAECTVSIYSSKTSTSSSYLKATKSFDDFADALAAIEREDDLEDEFDVSLGTNYAIRIKFGEDQELSSSYEFEPDYYYENPIFIDLNGHELKLPSDWIVYDDCEDLVVTITNSNDDDDGKLVYRDKSVTLTVADGSTLEFSEDTIPMDSDAAVTVNIYKSTSTTSSNLLKTKVYDDLEDLLDDLEKQEDALEVFDIDDDYEDDFVARIKLGEDEDQDLSTYTFAPDYDATIYIDLNGNKLTLKSEWIKYDSDNDGLSVKINNTHEKDKATLTYKDLNTSLTIAKGDTALEFKEDEIPGIYEISIGSMTNGKATMSKDTIGHGGTVKFTITPNSGYAIDTVKINSKTVSSSNYTVDSKGVGTYELKDITADSKLDVTFKKASSSTTTAEKEDNKTSNSDWKNPFTDVSSNAQYYDAVAFVCSEGLFNGMTATKFEPTTTMTRAMFVTVLGRLAGVDANRYSGTSFTDVSKTDQQISWAAPYIEWAVQNGITQGTGNGKFSPNDPITHQQMYLFMYRYAMFIENITTNITNVSLSSIKDASQIADWAQDGVKFASRNNILITSGGKLTPTDNALRCELAMLLEGFCTKVLGYND